MEKLEHNLIVHVIKGELKANLRYGVWERTEPEDIMVILRLLYLLREAGIIDNYTIVIERKEENNNNEKV